MALKKNYDKNASSNSSDVVAIIDAGKTNKKLFLFDDQYNIVYERSARFNETVDEDGFPCENLESLRLSVSDSLKDIFDKKEFAVKAVNFSAYGASFVHLDKDGKPVCPLYNYLKPFPDSLKEKFYGEYGGEEVFSSIAASPVLGNLNSGMQLYRLKYEKPQVFSRIKYALHLPQYLSYLVSGKACSDITSIGCHTNLWDFSIQDYHEWVKKEGIRPLLPPVCGCDETTPANFEKQDFLCGIGLHDSSAALIPYQMYFQEPFILISTGTWCISLNPFNESPLTAAELKRDCLCYLHYKGKPVKASRLFAGQEHEEGIQKIAAYFHQDIVKYRSLYFEPEVYKQLKEAQYPQAGSLVSFGSRDLAGFKDDIYAYHCLIMDIVAQQRESTQLVLNNSLVKRIFVDGGFSKNKIYMNLMAAAFPETEVYAASMAQATALGAALVIHGSWNNKPLPNHCIQLQYFASGVEVPDRL